MLALKENSEKWYSMRRFLVEQTQIAKTAHTVRCENELFERRVK
jgi:hypothetical protein